MEKKKNLINLIFSPKLLIIEWSIIIVFCIFIGFSIRGKCASQSSGEIPYNVAEMSSYNQIMLDKLEIALNKYYQETGYNSEAPILVWTNDGYFRNSFYEYYIMLEPQLRPGYTYTDGYNFTTDKIYFYSAFQIVRIVVRSDNNPPEVQLNQGIYATLCGNVQSVSTSIGSYLPLYPFYYNGEPLVDSSTGNEVLISRVNGLAPSGSATQPDLTGDDIGSDKPDIDDYLPNIPTMPSLDNSSLEKIAESIYNILQWGFNAIKGILQGLFEYLADTFTYSIQKVIDNIKNAIQNFYDNMKSLFEPLLNGLAEIAQGIKETIENIGALLEAFFAPFDEDQFKEAYKNCQFINAVDGVNDSIEEFEHAFTYAEERDYYKLYLGFMMDGYTVNYDLDFSWLYPLRQYYRPIIWAVVIYEFFVYLCSQLSDYLQGRSGK